jgi:CarboxypepD_reg-like domain
MEQNNIFLWNYSWVCIITENINDTTMKTNFQISIPTPCHEDWGKFTPTSTGGFCGSCQKNVIDFSAMSESQLVAYFRDLPADNQHLCGRFRDEQLQKNYDIESWFPAWNITDTTINYEVPITQFNTTSNTISLPLIRKMKMVRNMTMAVLTFAFSESYGQQKQIAGQVVDTEGLPLPGVSISIKNSKKGISSDKDGKYNLAVEDKDTLVFSFVGFKRNELTAKEIKPVVAMKEDTHLLGEVIVVGYSRTMGKMMTGGLVAIRENNKDNFDENPFNFHETNFQKCTTQIKAIGNPTITEGVIIVPEINPKTVFKNSEEKNLVENWYEENAFQNIESVEVYDLSGRVFEAEFYKINDGKIKVNLKNVPSGMCIVRVTYTNERSLEGTENSAVRVLVNR